MSALVNAIIRFVKDWSLPIAMCVGVLSYFIYRSFGFPPEVNHCANEFVTVSQPVLLFCMLFLSFCKIDPAQIRIKPWHVFLAAIQAVSFCGLALLETVIPGRNAQIIVECAMCCMICPTATAAVVIVDKLGGDKLTLVTYTIISNLVTATLVPLVVPIVNPTIGLSFLHSFGVIIRKVFPLLVIPFLLAWLVRVSCPRLLSRILSAKDLAFYLWLVALIFALAVTTRSLVHSGISPLCMLGIAVATLVCCAVQFVLGKAIGARNGDRISGGQALGQKNTVFMIWMGATFLDPVSAVAGGFYSIWHNTVNSWQLYKRRGEGGNRSK